MRTLLCSSEGCILKPKKMARTSQTGSGGVLQENTSTLVRLKTLRSATPKPAPKKRLTKPKADQTGKGRRTHKPKVSVVSSSKSKTFKRACAGKPVAKKSKTINKRSTKNTKK